MVLAIPRKAHAEEEKRKRVVFFLKKKKLAKVFTKNSE